MVQTGSQLGPYRLLRRIGAGGMAEVFLAQRIGAEGFARTVAIKTILAVGAEDEGIALFLDEARVAGFLEHAAIVQTVDLGFENDTLFIVMEYVAGPALSRVIRDLKKLGRFMPPEIVAYIGARVASALDYAHRRATTPDGRELALVHRDISPQNILLTRTGMVKLTDFGVARASVQTHKTRTGQVRGKAAYMAPEQVRAGLLDGRTDIFALALVLYESLTGVRAYQRKTDIMSMRAILTDPVQPIKELNRSVPDDLVAVIQKALAKKPNDRYSNAAEMAEALAATYRAVSDSSIEANITAMINELFGPEQFSNEGSEMGVEAWQPTISAKADGGEGSHPTPHRLSGARLSPKIAAMLQPPPQPTPQSSPRARIEEEWIDPATPNSSVTPVFTPSDAASPSVAYAGIAASAGLYSGAGRGDQPSFPGTPVSNSTPMMGIPIPSGASSAGIIGYASGQVSDPAVFAEVMNPQLVGSDATSAISMTDPAAVRPKGRAVIWLSIVLGSALVTGVAILAWNRAQENKAARAAAEGVVGMPAEVRVESRRPELPRTIEAPPRAASAPPLEAIPVDSPSRGERAVRKPRKSERAEAEPKGAAEAPKTKETAGAFLLRAMAAKKKVEADPGLQRELTKMINDLTITQREVTKADLELVKRAEGN